jgi:chemotaxis protein CheD
MATPEPAPADAKEVFLQPGEFHFGDAKTRIRTLLGSCVAIVLWHPRMRIGGMCHFMLPSRSQGASRPALDGRYGEEAMLMFMRELRRSGTSPGEYRTRLLGGGRMFHQPADAPQAIDICARNAQAARELVIRHGFGLHAEDLGGRGHRSVIFDLWSGDVWLKQVPLQPGPTVAQAVA